MAQAYSVDKNNYLKNTKNSAIFTPPSISKWIAKLIANEIKDITVLFDPAVGSGNLLNPYEGKIKIGCDIVDFGAKIDNFIKADFLDSKEDDYGVEVAVIANPPYNHSDASRAKWGKDQLLPELMIDKSFKMFGKKTPMVWIVPMGLRLNTRCNTKKQGERYRNIRDNWGEITSICSLPLDCFHNPDFDNDYPVQVKSPAKFKKNYPGMKKTDSKVIADPIKYHQKSNIKRKETHQEILFFNMPGLKPHIMLDQYVIDDLREESKELWNDNTDGA